MLHYVHSLLSYYDGHRIISRRWRQTSSRTTLPLIASACAKLIKIIHHGVTCTITGKRMTERFGCIATRAKRVCSQERRSTRLFPFVIEPVKLSCTQQIRRHPTHMQTLRNSQFRWRSGNGGKSGAVDLRALPTGVVDRSILCLLLVLSIGRTHQKRLSKHCNQKAAEDI